MNEHLRDSPDDSDAFFEFCTLTEQEKEWFYWCRLVCLEEGTEAKRAERDAMAAVLQHKRLYAPRSREYMYQLQKDVTEVRAKYPALFLVKPVAKPREESHHAK